MTYIVRRTKEVADDSVRDQVASIEAAVGTMFDEKMAPRINQLIAAVQSADPPAQVKPKAWLVHAGVAIGAAVMASATTALACFVVMPLPGK